jgi:hypothetical protein
MSLIRRVRGRRAAPRRPATENEIGWARSWADEEDHDADLDWTYTQDYGAHNLAHLVDWATWWQAEVDFCRRHPWEDPMRTYYRDALRESWTKGPQRDPIVITETVDGTVETIWDGWHRTAISVLFGAPLPALVGQRRT